MYSFFNRSIPEVTIFHHAISPRSTKALSILRAALTSPYPPKKSGAPLEFNLEVLESPPTVDQLQTIYTYLSPSESQPAAALFLSAHPSAPTPSERPSSLQGIAELAKRNPNAFRWPLVVDWNAGKAAVGEESEEGVHDILENIRRKRDGQA